MAVFVLQEVTHELVQVSLFSRVNIHLRENLVEGVNCTDRLWIRPRHALDLITVEVFVTVYGEQALQHPLVVLAMQLHHEVIFDHTTVLCLPSVLRSFNTLQVFLFCHHLRLALHMWYNSLVNGRRHASTLICCT